MPPALLARFADETDVFGLHLFNTHRSKFEIVFWCSFVLIFSCYTTKTLVNIVEQYVNEEVVSHVYQKREEAISFPFAEFCIQGEKAGPNLLPVDSALHSLLDTIEQKSIEDVNASAFVAVMDFLYQLQLSERKLELLRNTLSMSTPSFGVDVHPSIAIGLHTFAKRSKTSLADLSEILFRELCHNLQIQITFENKKMNKVYQSAEGLCDRGYPAILPSSPFSFCVDIHGEDFVFHSGSDFLRISFNATRAYEKLGVSPVRFGELWLNGLMSGVVDSAEYESTIIMMSGKRQSHNVRMIAEHQLLDLRRRRCVEEDAKRVWCKSGCESALFYAVYGCWPLIYRFQLSARRQNISNVRLCGGDDYLNSTRSPLVQRTFGCFESCFEPCIQRTFQISSLDLSTIGSIDQNIATASIYMPSFVHTVVEERLANDFESFLSNFGGALGLFLGMSLASIVHIPFFLLQSAIAYWRRTPKHTAETAGNDVEMREDVTLNELLRAVVQRLDGVESTLSSLSQAVHDMHSRNGSTL